MARDTFNGFGKMADLALEDLTSMRTQAKASNRASKKAAQAAPRLNEEDGNALGIVDARQSIAHEVIMPRVRRKLVMLGLVLEKAGCLHLTAAGEVAIQAFAGQQVKVRRVIK